MGFGVGRVFQSKEEEKFELLITQERTIHCR